MLQLSTIGLTHFTILQNVDIKTTDHYSREARSPTFNLEDRHPVAFLFHIIFFLNLVHKNQETPYIDTHRVIHACITFFPNNVSRMSTTNKRKQFNGPSHLNYRDMLYFPFMFDFILS